MKIMKKRLLYLFMLISSVSLFMSCSDDDDVKLSGKRVFMKSEGFIPESMTGMCGDIALRILRR